MGRTIVNRWVFKASNKHGAFELCLSCRGFFLRISILRSVNHANASRFRSSLGSTQIMVWGWRSTPVWNIISCRPLLTLSSVGQSGSACDLCLASLGAVVMIGNSAL